MQSGIFTTSCWKKTALGSPIALHASRSLAQLKNPIILLGGVHGDEPEGVELAAKTLAWLRIQDPSAIADWVVVPELNVDGLRMQQRTNGRGVDLNRNYPSRDWQAPPVANARYFPGPSPASEPEIQGVVELLRTLQPRLAIHCHSWQPCIVYAGKGAHASAASLAASSGYKLCDDIGYPTPGSLSSFAAGDLEIPVICIEEADRERRKSDDLQAIWPRFAAGMRAIFLQTQECRA